MDLWALLVSSFLAATILPFASEFALAIVIRRHGDLLLPVTIATIGNYLGACTTYGLARVATVRVAPKAVSNPPRALILFQRYGAPALFLSWVPIIGDAIVAAAGASRIGLLPFSIWTLAGKAARYAAVGWAVVHA